MTLHEGGTPLVRSRAFAEVSLYFKDEIRNPTGTPQDRPLSLSASHALASGARIMAAVSAGSTGLSNAAYAARAGLQGPAIRVAGAPDERIVPLAALGARLIEVEAGIDDAIAALNALNALNGRHGICVASTTRAANPVQAEAARMIVFEVVAELGRAPDIVILPVGGEATVASAPTQVSIAQNRSCPDWAGTTRDRGIRRDGTLSADCRAPVARPNSVRASSPDRSRQAAAPANASPEANAWAIGH